MFRICRVFIAFVFCAFCVGGVYADSQDRDYVKVTPRDGSGAVQSSKVVADSACKDKDVGAECKTNGSKDATCQERCVDSNCRSKKKLCVATSCASGFYLWVKQGNAQPGDYNRYASQGICNKYDKNWCNINGSDECKKNKSCKLRTFLFKGVDATDRGCVYKECDAGALEAAHAAIGFVIDENIQNHTENCQIEKCQSGYILNKSANRCEKCPECQAENATCKPTGSDGLGKCTYETECKDGYSNQDDEKKGLYNLVCSPNVYQITYNNGNTCISGDYVYSDTDEEKLCIPEPKEGFTFVGWCENSADCDKSILRLPAGAMGPKTFYAKWTAVAEERRECNEEEKAKFSNVKEFEFVKGVCRPKSCRSGYILREGKCVPCEPCEHLDSVVCDITSHDKNICIYKTSCKPEYKDIQYKNTKEAFCTRIPGTHNISFKDNEGNPVSGTNCGDTTYTEGESVKVDCKPTARPGYEPVWKLNDADVDMPYNISADDKGDKKFVLVSWKRVNCDDFNKSEAHAQEVVLQSDGSCKITQCEQDYVLNENKCVLRECNDSEKAKFPNADRFDFVGGACRPVHCARGYRLENGECVDDGIRAAEEEYASARENEMSLKNRLMSGAAIGTTGIGGMELASGIAEQSADAAAAADMAAYTQKMQCRVSDRRYRFNEKSVNVGGENALTGLYNEYVALADDLHERKDALGYAPGIESAVVFKREYTGLYDDVGSGVQNGTYASLYRASIGNPNDISRIADDAAKSETRIKTGAVVAGVGVIGGIVGNSLINGKLSKKIEERQEKKNSKIDTTKIVSVLDKKELVKTLSDADIRALFNK